MLRFDMSDTYQGMGVSRGLDRGVLVYHDGTLLLEEGMGLGACALQTNEYTYFASVKTIQKIESGFAVVLDIDQQLVWQVFGVNVRLLTRILEKLTTHIYMKQEKRQNAFLELGNKLRQLFKVSSCFITVPKQAVGLMMIKVGDNRVAVDLSMKTAIKNGKRKIFVMNELGGSHFNKGLINGDVISPPTGWQKLEESAELYSAEHGLAFTMAEIQIPVNVKSALFWGRESISNNYCWAGFESELSFETQQFEHYKYVIKFKEVKY